MKIIFVLPLLLLSACAPNSQQFEHNQPNLEHVPHLEQQISQGWPFQVSASVGDYDGPEDFISRLRGEFLCKLAQSPFRSRISNIYIDARSPIYASWSCSIILKGTPSSILIGENVPFYNPHSDSPYEDALAYISSLVTTP